VKKHDYSDSAILTHYNEVARQGSCPSPVKDSLHSFLANPKIETQHLLFVNSESPTNQGERGSGDRYLKVLTKAKRKDL
jgi:hypothetical protein